MRWLVTLFLLAVAGAIALTFARDLTSRERRRLAATVVAYHAQSGNESRTIPIPGDIEVRLADGRTLRLSLREDRQVKPGSEATVTEMVAPWGAIWYRLATVQP